MLNEAINNLRNCKEFSLLLCISSKEYHITAYYGVSINLTVNNRPID